MVPCNHSDPARNSSPAAVIGFKTVWFPGYANIEPLDHAPTDLHDALRIFGRIAGKVAGNFAYDGYEVPKYRVLIKITENWKLLFQKVVLFGELHDAY